MSLAFYIGFLQFRLVDALDILLASSLLYVLYGVMRGRIGERLMTGALLFYLFYLITKAAGMRLLTAMLGKVMEWGVLAAIILFQQEIRKLLFLLGDPKVLERTPFYQYLPWVSSRRRSSPYVGAILDAAKQLAATNTGALMVLTKTNELKSYEETGDPVGAIISKRLLLAIFNKTSPLHDGAVVLYKDRITAARCVLPVTEQSDLPAHFGLRHRAALGITEVTATCVVVVSEETGQLAVAQGGSIQTNLSLAELRASVNTYLTK